MSSSIILSNLRRHATFPRYGRPATVGECAVDYKVPFSRKVVLAPSVNSTVSSTNDIRAEFLSFFQEKDHTLVAPSSIYPKRQEGSYFVNAGMNQFKPLFIGNNSIPDSGYSDFSRLGRAANSQPCIRIGGRHDDLNDVGYDTYHHTMFEMLGNWSFGDYGKETACLQMWQFLTGVLGLPPSSLYVTYFGGSPELGLPADDETRYIWLNLGVSDQKLMAFGTESNFWRADQASGGGLCGPSTEIHVDYAALSGRRDLSCARCMVNAGDARMIELWNCVFISHRMVEESGYRIPLIELPKTSVDTGMGLERLASVMQRRVRPARQPGRDLYRNRFPGRGILVWISRAQATQSRRLDPRSLGTMTTYDTDTFVELLGFIHSESGRLTCSPVPAYSSQYFLPEEEPQSSGCASLPSSAATRRAKPSALSALLRALTSSPRKIVEECESKDKKTASPVDYATLHRDIAYRLIADHIRSLNLAMEDGLLPGRQGVGLKLRHLIHRATRAAVLVGLDSATNPRLLSSLMRSAAPLLSPPRWPFDLEGPSARPRDPILNVEQISSIIHQEVQRFVPRLEKTEDAFHACLRDGSPDKPLTASQIHGLMSGRYGEAISWDMISAQARWYGVKTPDEPPPNPPPAPPHLSRGNSPPAGSRRSAAGRQQQGSAASPSSQQGKTPGVRPLLSSLPVTKDNSKYHVERVTLSNYVVPPLQANLIALVIVQGAGKIEVINDPSRFTEASIGCCDRLGLVFDRTNFFSPSGGQASDSGVIKASSSQTPIFEVTGVEKFAENTSAVSSDGWVVHWVKASRPTNQFALGENEHLQLCPDSNVRSGLMRHHTSQHLLNWAFGVELAAQTPPNNGDGVASTMYHGSRVDRDRCTVRLTLFDIHSHLETLVESVEARCRAVIDAKLPVVCQEAPLELASEKPFVKRFAWEAYPPRVRAVSIGGDLHALEERLSGPPSFHSAELCGGTHVHRTEDLIDVVVVGLRSRNQSVKEFVAISGEEASRARECGQGALRRITAELDAITTASMAAMSCPGGSPEDLVDCAERLQHLLSRVNSALGAPREASGAAELPFLVRCSLVRFQARLPGLLGDIKVALRETQPGTPEACDSLEWAQLLRIFQRHDDNASGVVVAPFTISRVQRVAQCLVTMAPNKPAVVFHKALAIVYHPHLNAAKWAESTVKRLQLPEDLSVEISQFKNAKENGCFSQMSLLRLIPRSGSKCSADWQSYTHQLLNATASNPHS